jgi:hypothetical protein
MNDVYADANSLALSRRAFSSATIAAICSAHLVHGVGVSDEGHDDASPDSPRPIKSLRRLDDTVLRLGGHGDNWHMTWAKNDTMYVGLCDGKGLPGARQGFFNSRMYSIIGEPPKVRFADLPGYPDLPFAVNRYYGFGILAFDRQIYHFLSTPIRRLTEPEPLFVGAKLIYSDDDGATWRNQDGSSPVRWEDWKERSKENMIFFQEPNNAFSLLSVLQMGKNYENNQDGFIYIYSPNGTTDGTMNQLVLARVPKQGICRRKSYEFFAGPDGSGRPKWSGDIQKRKPVHEFPRGWVNRYLNPYAWQPSVVYFASAGQYLMANWGMGTDSGGRWFTKPSYLGFWTAPKPWGPWTQVHEEQSWTPEGEQGSRAYQPQIAPKWIAADGESFWLVWTDFSEHKRNYAFNAQRVAVEY